MRILAPIGRFLFSSMFIMSGISHLAQLEALSGYAASAGVPAARYSVVVSGLMLLFGGLAVLTGALTRIGAALIALFLFVAAFLVHDFWSYPDVAAQQEQLANFVRNLALAGAALLIVYFGPGPYSLRQRRRRGLRAQATEPGYKPPLRPRPQE